MEQRGRLEPTMTGWKCLECGFESQLSLEMAHLVHSLCSSQCMSGTPAEESQSTTGSIPGPGQLELDAASVSGSMPLDQRRQTSWMQPLGQSSDDQVAAGSSFGQIESDDVPENREREAVNQQLTTSREQEAIKVELREFRCVICFKKWRSVATTVCLHLGCCKACAWLPECAVCRGVVTARFPVEFHSSKLLEDLDIPFLLNLTPGESNLQDLVQIFLVMGFQESKVRRAIHLIQLESGKEELPTLSELLDFLDCNPFPVPSLEEMEILLDSSVVDIAVKSRLYDYLEAISKCMVCRSNPPCICLMTCGHLALCRECFSKHRPNTCPDCGSAIENQVRVFMP